jgi:aspartyl protease
VQINDSSRSYIFDTGANFSTIMRSEAGAVGLRILPAGIEVGTSTDKKVTADLAIADRLTIGGMHLRNVVFLVLDDKLLTFAGGFRIPGIVGFPVIEQMGEFEIDHRSVLKIPLSPPRRTERNLALENLTPLTQVAWQGKTLLCSFDTGAQNTAVYETFYRRFQPAVDASSTASVRKMGGAGGILEVPVRVFTKQRFSLGDTTMVLDSVDVLTRSIAHGADDDYRDCNLGHDILDKFSGFILNFRDMAFVLR